MKTIFSVVIAGALLLMAGMTRAVEVPVVVLNDTNEPPLTTLAPAIPPSATSSVFRSTG